MRMSDLLGEKVGQTVGYRVRMDSRVSPATRIEVVTEGVVTVDVQKGRFIGIVYRDLLLQGFLFHHLPEGPGKFIVAGVSGPGGDGR